jgi:hypothetical protein
MPQLSTINSSGVMTSHPPGIEGPQNSSCHILPPARRDDYGPGLQDYSPHGEITESATNRDLRIDPNERGERDRVIRGAEGGSV